MKSASKSPVWKEGFIHLAIGFLFLYLKGVTIKDHSRGDHCHVFSLFCFDTFTTSDLAPAAVVQHRIHTMQGRAARACPGAINEPRFRSLPQLTGAVNHGRRDYDFISLSSPLNTLNKEAHQFYTFCFTEANRSLDPEMIRIYPPPTLGKLFCW